MHKLALALGAFAIISGITFYFTYSRDIIADDRNAPRFELPSDETVAKPTIEIRADSPAKVAVSQEARKKRSLEIISEAPTEFYVMDPVGRTAGATGVDSEVETIPQATYVSETPTENGNAVYILTLPEATLGEYTIHVEDGNDYMLSIKSSLGNNIYEKVVQQSVPYIDETVTFTFRDDIEALVIKSADQSE